MKNVGSWKFCQREPLCNAHKTIRKTATDFSENGSGAKVIIDKCDIHYTKTEHFDYQLFAKREFNGIVQKQRVAKETLSSYSLQEVGKGFFITQK